MELENLASIKKIKFPEAFSVKDADKLMSYLKSKIEYSEFYHTKITRSKVLEAYMQNIVSTYIFLKGSIDKQGAEVNFEFLHDLASREGDKYSGIKFWNSAHIDRSMELFEKSSELVSDMDNIIMRYLARKKPAKK